MQETKTTDGRQLVALARALGRDLIVFDLEHTSGAYESFGIMEMACLRIRPDSSITRMESLFNPEVPIPPMISKLTKIFPSMVKAKPKWGTTGASFVLSNQEAVWIGFNSRASDVKRIQALHRLQGLDVPVFAYQIDLMRFGKRIGNHVGTLTELTRIHAPDAVVDAHRAYADVKMTAALLEAWLSYALDNLGSLLEPVEVADSKPSAYSAKQAGGSGNKNEKTEANPTKREVSAHSGGNYGKRWGEDEVDLVKRAVDARQVDVVALSQQLGRSMFAVALKAVSFGFRDADWAESIKQAQVDMLIA